MGKSPNTRDGSPPPSTGAAVTLVADIANITWRMFVPTIVFLLVGLWADSQFDTAPWLLLLGIVIGITVTVLLVRRQYMRVKQSQ